MTPRSDPRGVPRAGRRVHGRPGLARAAGRPDHPGRRLRPAVPRRRARLPARVGRARRAVGPLVVRRPPPGRHARSRAATARSRSTGGTLPDGIPLDEGILAARRGRAAPVPLAAARRPAAAARRPRRLPRLRRRARGRAPARRPRRRPGLPRRGAVDHRRAGRLRPLPPAGHADRQRATCFGDRTDADLDRIYDEAVARLDQLAADGATPLDEPLVDPPDPRRRRCPRSRSTMGAANYGRAVEVGQGAHPRRRHLPGGAGPALRLRARRRPVRRLPGAAPGQPEPVHVLRAPAAS